MNPEEVKDLQTEMENQWSRIHADMDDYVNYYEQTFTVPVEKGFEAYKPPTATRIIDTAADNIIVSNEVITVPPRAMTKEAQEAADRLEKFYTWLVQRIDRVLPAALLRIITKQALLYGIGVVKGPFWDENQLDKPIRRSGESKKDFEERLGGWEIRTSKRLPIILLPGYPRQVMFPLDIYPVPWVIEVGQRSARYIKNRYGITIPGKAEEELVDWVEYWDEEERCFLAEGIPVLPDGGETNIGGFIPYSFVFSGLGSSPSSLASPQAVRGLLHSVRGAIRQQAKQMTVVDIIVERFAFRKRILPESLVSRMSEEPGPGGDIVVPDALLDKIHYEELPPTIPDLYNRLRMLEAEIERATFTAALEGQFSPGVDAGYPRAIAIGQGRLKFTPLIAGLERARAEMLGNTGRLLEALDESITLWGNAVKGKAENIISGKDFAGHYLVEVKLSGVSPEEADRRTMLGQNLRKPDADGRPSISRRRLLEEYLGIANATEEEDMIAVEEILASPEIKRVLAQEALRRWAGEEAAKALEEALSSPPESPASPGMLGGGSGMPGLTPTPPGVPRRPAQEGSPEAFDVWYRRLKRGTQATQGQPLGGPRESVE